MYTYDFGRLDFVVPLVCEPRFTVEDLCGMDTAKKQYSFHNRIGILVGLVMRVEQTSFFNPLPRSFSM